jgi:hypothetical protein
MLFLTKIAAVKRLFSDIMVMAIGSGIPFGPGFFENPDDCSSGNHHYICASQLIALIP